MKLKHIIILQNKIELIQESVAINQHESIQKFIQVQELESCFYDWVAVGDESVFCNVQRSFWVVWGWGQRCRQSVFTWILWLYLLWLWQGTIADGALVVPISGQLKYNVDVVCEYIVNKIPIPRWLSFAPSMLTGLVLKWKKAREVLQVAVFWGYLFFLKLILLLQCLPIINSLYLFVTHGRIIQLWDVFREYWKLGRKLRCNLELQPRMRVVASSAHISAEQNELQFSVPGSLLGVGTTIDPTLKWADWLVGQVLGEVGELPDVFVELEVIPHPRTQNLSPFYLPMSLYGHISNNGSYAKLSSFFEISDLNSWGERCKR